MSTTRGPGRDVFVRNCSDTLVSSPLCKRAIDGANHFTWWRLKCVYQSPSRNELGGRFIVDFFASAAGLIVEVDGGYHARRRCADASCDRKLRRLGYRVVRLEAELVLRGLPAAIALVRAAL